MNTDDEQISKREVEKSFRRFEDSAEDLLSSSHSTWWDNFCALMHHCDNDPILHLVTGPLKEFNKVDPEEWWEKASSPEHMIIGSGRYMLPYNEDEKVALLFQVFLMVIEKKKDVSQFCMMVFGETEFDGMVYEFNDKLVRVFVREFKYKLREVLDDASEDSVVKSDALIVYNSFISTNIGGNVQGGIVATGSPSISGIQIQINSTTELANELRAIKSLAKNYSRTNQSILESALESLASSAENSQFDRNEVIENSRTIREISAEIGSKVLGFVSSVGSNLVAAGFIEAVKVGLGA